MVRKNTLEENEIVEKLASLKSTMARNPQKAARNRSLFLHQAIKMREESVSQKENSRLTLQNRMKFKEFKMGTLTTLIVILGLIFGGGASTVYASQNTTPGDALYPVKVVYENARLDLTTSPEAKLELLLQYSNENVDDLIAANQSQNPQVEWAMNNLLDHLNAALGIALQQQDQDRLQTMTRLQTMLQTMEQKMDQQMLQTMDQTRLQTLLRTRDILETRLQIVNSGMVDPGGLYNSARNGWTVQPPTEPGQGQNQYCTPTGAAEQNQEQNQQQNQNQYQCNPTETPVPGSNGNETTPPTQSGGTTTEPANGTGGSQGGPSVTPSGSQGGKH